MLNSIFDCLMIYQALLYFSALKKFLVVAKYNVVGEFTNVELAKLKLNSITSGSKLIAEVNDRGVLMTDPHLIDGTPQTSEFGFKKYWNSWHDIIRMMSICRRYLNQGKYYLMTFAP